MITKMSITLGGVVGLAEALRGREIRERKIRKEVSHKVAWWAAQRRWEGK